jgi:hypothetical protein
MTTWQLVTSAALLAGAASAADPAKIQDPPGSVGVDQPAGVSTPERNTERDTTDTLNGGGQTDVIAGKRAASRPSGPSIQAGQASGAVQPGTEARAGFEETTQPRPANPTPATRGGEAEAGSASDSTTLGTDLGYGTATEPNSPSR